MRRGATADANTFLKEKKVDLIFSVIALILVGVMIFFLVRYSGLRKQNQARPEEYGAAMQELNNAKNEKNALESQIDALLRDIDELNKKITALRGN